MTEPKTDAGRELRAMLRTTTSARVDYWETILAIEAEAEAPLRVALLAIFDRAPNHPIIRTLAREALEASETNDHT